MSRMTEQHGHTKTDPVYPAFVNIAYDGDTGEFVLTMRGDPRVENGIVFGAGHTCSMRLSAREAHDVTNGLHLFVTEGKLHG